MALRRSSNSALTLRLALLASGTFVLGVDGFVLAGLLPSVARDLGVSVATAGQLTTGFALTYAVASPVIATATGRLDRRVVLLAGMVVFLAGMAAQAAGPDFTVVLIGRMLAALGAAAYQANAYAVAGVIAPAERRGRALAVVAAGSSLATIAGVPFGVLIGDWAGWRGAMWFIAALALVSAVLTLALPAIHLPHMTLRARLSTLLQTRLLAMLALTALVLVPQFGVTSYIAPLVGQTGQGGIRSLLALLAFGAAFFAGNRLVGVVIDRRGAERVLIVGLAATCASLIALGIGYGHIAATIAALVALGFVGPAQLTSQQTRVFNAAGDAATAALGLNGSMIYLGSAAGASLGGATLSAAGARGIPFAAAIIAALGLGLVVAQAKRSQGRRRKAPERPVNVGTD